MNKVIRGIVYLSLFPILSLVALAVMMMVFVTIYEDDDSNPIKKDFYTKAVFVNYQYVFIIYNAQDDCYSAYYLDSIRSKYAYGSFFNISDVEKYGDKIIISKPANLSMEKVGVDTLIFNIYQNKFQIDTNVLPKKYGNINFLYRVKDI